MQLETAVMEKMELQIYPSIYKSCLALFDHFSHFSLAVRIQEGDLHCEGLWEKPPLNQKGNLHCG